MNTGTTLLFVAVSLAGCATSPTDADHESAVATALAVRANVPRAIARARERGPEAEARARKEARRWLLGTSYCSAADQAALERTLAECLAFSGSYVEAKRQFWADRWNYVGALGGGK